MSLDIQNSSDLIEQINSLKNDNNGRLALEKIIIEIGEFINLSDKEIKHNKKLLKLAHQTGNNILDFEEYKKSFIQYILLAEKLLYPERKQDISDTILTTGDLVYDFIPEKLGMSHINK